MNWAKTQKNTRGFTIVELLIVIVVIAILAAITIVGYNGITQNANSSAAASSARQAAQKVRIAVAQDGATPAELKDVGITDNGSISYQYRVLSTADKFCVTATSGQVSFYVLGDGTPTKGACAGHGEGGVATIQNLVSNPRATSYLPPAEGKANVLNTRYPTYTTYSIVPTTGLPGGVTRAFSKTTNAVFSGADGFEIGYNPDVSPTMNGVRVKPNTEYTLSAYVRQRATASTMGAYFRYAWYTAAGDRTGGAAISGASVVQMPVQNQWYRLVQKVTAPANAHHIGMTVARTNTNAVGDIFDMGAPMITEGPTTYNYADGESSGWAWLGDIDKSSSMGPLLP